MNRTPRLGKTGIEYLDYVWNFASGCTKGCEHCWAKKRVARFHQHYPNGFEPTVYPEALLAPLRLWKASIIGCVFMGDLFDDAIDPCKMVNVPIVPGLAEARPLREYVFRTIEHCPQHRFLFLTKQPQNLAKWSPFPDNCWVGVSVTDFYDTDDAILYLERIEAKVKFLSMEPMLGEIPVPKYGFGVDWIIIGPQTKPKVMPDLDWIRPILADADERGTPVFLKDGFGWPRMTHNGSPPFYRREIGTWVLRREMPKVKEAT